MYLYPLSLSPLNPSPPLLLSPPPLLPTSSHSSSGISLSPSPLSHSLPSGPVVESIPLLSLSASPLRNHWALHAPHPSLLYLNAYIPRSIFLSLPYFSSPRTRSVLPSHLTFTSVSLIPPLNISSLSFTVQNYTSFPSFFPLLLYASNTLPSLHILPSRTP